MTRITLDRILGKLTPEERDFLSELIDKDPLTGVYNRRKFDQDLELIISMSERTQKGSSLIFIDIDHFKEFNDTYGHQKGDEVLKKLGQCIVMNLRDYDKIHIYRYGGEEFVILIPDITSEDACHIAERVREGVKSSSEVTISVGVSHYKEISDTVDGLLKHADQALYQAKQRGRNRVEIYERASLA